MGQAAPSEPIYFIEPKFPIYTTTKDITAHTAFGPLFYDYECDGCGGSYSCPHYYFKEDNRTWILHAIFRKTINMIIYCHGDEEFQHILQEYSKKLESVPFAITFEEDHVMGQKLFCEIVKKHQNIHELTIGHGKTSNEGDVLEAIQSMPAMKKIDILIQNFNEHDLQFVPGILKNGHIEEFIMHHIPKSATFWTSFCSALASNTTLKKFTLLPSAATIDLSPMGNVLESNKTLKELNIMMQYPNTCDALLKSLKTNATLEALSISLNSQENVDLFRDVMKINKNLKNLTVSCYLWQHMDVFWDGIGLNGGLVTLNLKYVYDINYTMGSLCVAALKNFGIKKLLVNDAAVTLQELRLDFAQYKMNIRILSRQAYLPAEIWTCIIKKLNIMQALQEDLVALTEKYKH